MVAIQAIVGGLLYGLFTLICLRRIYPWCGDATRLLCGGIAKKA
jgi:hypothetical protein